MKTLSLGGIGKIATYSRVRIYQLAVAGKIPFKPIKQPPEGQYRYEDTPKLREWCEEKRRTKPRRAQHRRYPWQEKLPTYSRIGMHARGCDEAVLNQMALELITGHADPSDVENAIKLLDACALVRTPVADEPDQSYPCIKGTLIHLAKCLLNLPLYNDGGRIPTVDETLSRLRQNLEWGAQRIGDPQAMRLRGK